MAIHEDRRKVTIRLTVLQYLIIVVFSVLAVSFWVLQVVQHAKFEEMAENNNQRTLALRAPRGVVFDRDGRVLVENRHSYSISIVREHTKDLNRTIRLLAAVLGLDEAGVRDDRRPASPRADVSGRSRSCRTRRWRRSRPSPRGGSTSSCRTSSSSRCRRGSIRPRRWRRTSSATSARSTTRRSPTTTTLKSGDIVGQSGIEKVYNALLMGEDGAQARRRQQRRPRDPDARRGAADRRQAPAADDRLRRAEGDRGRLQGGAVSTARRSCSIRATAKCSAFTSVPAYDPNAFAAGIDRATWASLNTDELKPLQDRAIQGRYSPGSTFKMAVALAALEEGIITPDFQVLLRRACELLRPRLQVLDRRAATASIDLRHAIEQSCDVYFYTVAQHGRRSTRSTSGRRCSASA